MNEEEQRDLEESLSAMAGDFPDPKRYPRLHRGDVIAIIVGIVFIVVGVTAAVLWGNAVLDYVWDQLTPTPEFTPTQLETL